MGNRPIEFCDNARDLGLILDSDLRFEEHVGKCIRIAFANLKKLYGSGSVLDQANRIMLCDALVLSHFNYGSVVYGPCLSATVAAMIQRVQNACVRFVCGLRRRDHVSSKLGEIEWLNKVNRRKLGYAMFCRRIIESKKPFYLYSRIEFRRDAHTVNLRNKNLITPPIHRTTL
ncbi:uncharacterized protein [Onthophagus taurus]|uniref:uncharacterized protein n=1 Tax=Onthophagus taurus TaxID=166361 RepID=UPI0039BE434A